MIKKTIILLFFIFFCRFTLLVCANLTNIQEPDVFGSLEPEPLEKKPGAGAALEKNLGAGAAWKKSPEPEPEKNLPAPQPWY